MIVSVPTEVATVVGFVASTRASKLRSEIVWGINPSPQDGRDSDKRDPAEVERDESRIEVRGKRMESKIKRRETW